MTGVGDFNQVLAEELERIRATGLHRELRPVESAPAPVLALHGRQYLNFASNDYLGLANDPSLKEAAVEAVRQFGAGTGAARLICGSLRPHHELEEALAAFKGTGAALTFASGYATAVGTIPALVGRGDLVIVDRLAHACLVDGARLSGATLRVFAHNDLDALETVLRRADQRAAGSGPSPAPAPGRQRILIVTESVFSMDGDLAPLPELVALKARYGAWLLVDEAHATGLYGAQRRGVAEAEGVASQIEVQMGTLGKALGAAGGFIAGTRVLIDYLVNRARSFMFSTAPVPAAAAAALAALRLVQSDQGRARCAQLWERVRQVASLAGPPTGLSPIFPLILGDEAEALRAAEVLRTRGLFVPAVRFPTVARGAARLRLTVTAAHTAAQVAHLGEALAATGWPPQ